MEDSKEFNEVEFEQKLLKLKDTQEGIQGLSMWCLQKRENHKKIVATWLNVLKQGLTVVTKAFMDSQGH